MKITTMTLAALLTLTTQLAMAKTLIVSDVDDTIKMTGILNGNTTIAWNGLVRTKGFSGMSELYKELETDDTTIFYVSGSPKIIRTRVSEFLEENEFPQQPNLMLKDWITDDTVHYKTESIKTLIAQYSPDKVILIGDDTEHDPEIYDGVAKLYPKLVESIYIRSISNRELPNNALIKTYFSSVEIAGLEMIKGQLSANSLRRVARGFLRQTNDTGVAMRNAYCPTAGREQIEEIRLALQSQSVDDVFEKTQAKIIRSCN